MSKMCSSVFRKRATTRETGKKKKVRLDMRQNAEKIKIIIIKIKDNTTKKLYMTV